MAGRIRTIKPEIWGDQRFAERTDAARVLFLGLYSLADDHGNCQASPRYLGGQIFCGRPRSPAVIGRLLSELEEASLIKRYTSEGSPYLSINGWRKEGTPTHQRIDKPQKPRFPLPRPSDSTNVFAERSAPDPTSDHDRDQDQDLGAAGPAADRRSGGRDAQRRERAADSLSAAAAPAGSAWRPPPGGKADTEAKKRIAAGELADVDVTDCWDAFGDSEHASKPNADAIAAAWVRRQKPRARPTGGAYAKPRRRNARIEPSPPATYGVDVPTNGMPVMRGK